MAEINAGADDSIHSRQGRKTVSRSARCRRRARDDSRRQGVRSIAGDRPPSNALSRDREIRWIARVGQQVARQIVTTIDYESCHDRRFSPRGDITPIAIRVLASIGFLAIADAAEVEVR